MLGLIFIIVLIVIAVAFVSVLVQSETRYPYKKRGALLTPAELKFFHTLERAVERQYRLFIKVRVADLITVKKEGDNKRTLIAVNRIAAKHVDFVLADMTTLTPIAAIELDDSSHQRADRRKRDEFLEGAFDAAGVKLIRFKTQGRYEINAVLQQITVALTADAVISSRTDRPRVAPSV